ncbi:hypothetical protein FACS18945_4320 [Bacteroidia bacterium]|nr:hypothetical protein FACS18945_4320 [Bacteroidia bacterium]
MFRTLMDCVLCLKQQKSATSRNKKIVNKTKLQTLIVLGTSRRFAPVGVTAEGFRAWFILQHYRGYRPFVTVMEKKYNWEGQL